MSNNCNYKYNNAWHTHEDVVKIIKDELISSGKYDEYGNPLNILVPNLTDNLFGIESENTDRLLRSSTKELSIGDYLGVDTQRELMDALRGSANKLKIFFDISPDASVEDVFNFMYNDEFSLSLIPTGMVDEFIDNARKYLGDGTFSSEYHSLFTKIGKTYVANLVYNNYFISGNSVFVNGKEVGEYERQNDGSYTMDDNIIVDFVSIMSDKALTINSSSTNVVSKLKDLGYNAVINDGRIIVTRPVNGTVVGSINEASEILEKIKTDVHALSSDFFGNIKASNRVVNPFVSLLLDSSSMSIDQIVDLIKDSINESVEYIEKTIKEASEFTSVNIVDADIFSDIHVIEDELIPLLYGLLAVLNTANKNNDYSSIVDDVIKKLGIVEPELKSFSDMYMRAVENYLQSKYGFSTEVFNSKYGHGSQDINPLYYYVKYPESSRNYHVRLAVALIKNIKAEQSVDEANYKKIDKLIEKIKEGRYSDVDMLYEKDDRKNATGYLISPIKWGKFNDALDIFLGFLSNPDAKDSRYTANGLYDRDVSAENWAEYRRDVNNWLKQHTVSPMDQSYLDAIASLSKDTYIQYIDSRSHLTSLFSRLSGYDIANDTRAYREFNKAYKNYLYMFSMYEYDGTLKKYTNIKMHKIALELNKFHEVFNPTESSASSTKYDEFMEELHKAYVDKKISATEFRKRRKLLSGFTSDAISKKNKEAELSALGSLIKIYTSNGIDNNSFSNASNDVRATMINLFLSEGFEPYYNGYTEESPEYSRTVKYYREKYGENNYIKKMEDDYVSVPGTDGLTPNPLFFIFLPKAKDTTKPSPIFSLDPNTFTADASNPYFDYNTPYSLSPNPALYGNEEFYYLSDRQRELVDMVLEILVDINRNNGTVAMYGPLFPQISSTGLSRGYRAMQSGKNPLSAIAYMARTQWTYNNESLSSIIGFKKEANLPSSLFAKNSQRLIIPNTIARDLPMLLSRGYSDSLLSKYSTKYMYSIKSVADSARDKKGVNNPSASSLITSITKRFIGIEDLSGSHKKGDWNIGAIAQSAIGFVRSVYLSNKWLPIVSNMANATIVLATDPTFVSREGLMRSSAKAAHSVLNFAYNKFTKKTAAEPEIINMMRLSGVFANYETKHKTYYGGRFGRFIADNFWYGGYSISDVMSLFPISETVFSSIKYYDGKFMHKYEFIDKYAERDSSGLINNKARRAALKKFNSIETNIYDAFIFNKDGSYIIKKEFVGSNVIASLEMARSIIEKKHRLVAGNKANSLSPTVDNVFSPQIFMYKGWLINAINTYTNFKYSDPIIKVEIESQYTSAYKMLLSALTYMPVMGELMREYTDKNTGEKKDRRYLDQYQIDNGKHLVNTYVAMIVNLMSSVVMYSMILQLLNNLDDDDDELSFKDKVLIATATLISRVGNELFGMHTMSMNDVFNSISSTGNPLIAFMSLVGKNIEEAEQISSVSENMTDEEIADFEESTGKTINEAITEKILAFTPGGPGYLSTKEMLFGDYGSYMQLYNSRAYNKMYEFLDNKYYEKFVYKEDKESDNSDSLMKVVE